jgi:hypothetical protein
MSCTHSLFRLLRGMSAKASRAPEGIPLINEPANRHHSSRPRVSYRLTASISPSFTGCLLAQHGYYCCFIIDILLVFSRLGHLTGT